MTFYIKAVDVSFLFVSRFKINPDLDMGNTIQLPPICPSEVRVPKRNYFCC